MDDLTVLKSVRDDVAPPSAQTLADVRARLTESGATVRPIHRPRLRVQAAVGLVAAAAVATGVFIATGDDGSNPTHPVVSKIAGPRPPSGTTSAPAPVTAAMLLNTAADVSLKTGDPVVGRGQFLYVNTHAWETATVGGEVSGTITAKGALKPTGHKSRQVTYFTENRYEMWMPRNGKGTWYWRYHYTTATRFLSASDKRYVEQHYPQVLHPEVMLSAGRDDQITHLIGHPGDNSPLLPASWGLPTPAYLAAQPRAPKALLKRLFQDPNKGNVGGHRYDNAFYRIGLVLSTGIVPADLRAALYRVAANEIPGVTITDRAAVLDGRHGIAVGRVQSTPLLAAGMREEFVFDSAGGQFIGEREVLTHPRGMYRTVPAGTVLESTSVTVGVRGKPAFAG